MTIKTHTQIKTAPKGKHKIESTKGLYLIVGAQSRRFILRMNIDGRQHEFVLGRFPELSLAEAAKQAQIMAPELRANGGKTNEQVQKESQRNETFETVANEFFEDRQEKWKNANYTWQWRQSLDQAIEAFGHLPCREVTKDHVYDLCLPAIKRAPANGTWLSQRIKAVLDKAAKDGYRDRLEPNPADPNENTRLGDAIASNKKPPVPHNMVEPDAMPKFMEELRGRNSVSALCLEFTILTAVRASNAILAEWDQIDLDNALWTIPAKKMKAEKNGDHVVPLSPRAVEILKKVEGRHRVWVFPSNGNHLGSTAMRTCLKHLRDDVTVHGFRATFRTWMSDNTDYPTEVGDAALHHTVSHEVRARYQRTSFIDKRRNLMNDWCAYCRGVEAPVIETPETVAPVADIKAQVDALKAANVPSDVIMESLLAGGHSERDIAKALI